MSNVPQTEKDEEVTQLKREKQLIELGLSAGTTAEDAERKFLRLVEIFKQLDKEYGVSALSDAKKEIRFLHKAQTYQIRHLHPKYNKIEKRLEVLYEILRKQFNTEPEVNEGGLTALRDQLKNKISKFKANIEKYEKENGEGAAVKNRANLKTAEEQLQQTYQPTNKGTPGNMSKDLSNAVESGTTKINNVEVVRHGDKLTIPTNLNIYDAIKLLQARANYEEEVTRVVDQIDVFPWDGALALGVVLKNIFGWVPQQGASIQVNSGVNEKVSVPWGEFAIPGIDGKIITQSPWKDGRVTFQVMAMVKNKHEHVVRDIFAQVRERVRNHSLYRGKAVKVRFVDDDGDKLPLPEPEFIDVLKIDENAVAYAKPVQDAIETNLFTPIRRIKELEANGLSIKRSVMLGGVYGTGKTLAAGVAAKLAVQQGMTYIYVSRADELTHALKFSEPYQDPAVMLFCEDLDRVMSGGRSVAVDDILNTIDGVDSKNARRMLVFTTNAIEDIEPAMIRPGRLDAVIEVTPPDAQAAWKLVKIYGGASLASNVDSDRVGEALAGQIPAVIAEVVRRSKLSQLKFTPVGQRVIGITTEALLDAAQTMRHQLDLLNRQDDGPMELDEAVAVVGEALGAVHASPKAIHEERMKAKKAA